MTFNCMTASRPYFGSSKMFYPNFDNRVQNLMQAYILIFKSVGNLTIILIDESVEPLIVASLY